MKSFLECTNQHMLTMFSMDAAEQQWYYIYTVVKKPTRVLVHACVTFVGKLNSYIALLPPSIYDSPKGTSMSTRPSKPFSKCKVAINLLLQTGSPRRKRRLRSIASSARNMEVHLTLTTQTSAIGGMRKMVTLSLAGTRSQTQSHLVSCVPIQIPLHNLRTRLPILRKPWSWSHKAARNAPTTATVLILKRKLGWVVQGNLYVECRTKIVEQN